jgi:hypothetical protein
MIRKARMSSRRAATARTAKRRGRAEGATSALPTKRRGPAAEARLPVSREEAAAHRPLPRIGPGANRRLLDQILNGRYPDETLLDPPFDRLARAGLAERIAWAGVPVDPAVVIACTNVGCVHAEMNRVNPRGR